MSESYLVLSAELPELETLYPIIEAESQSRRQTLFLEWIDEQFDSEYEEDLTLEDIAIEGDRLVVEFQCSTELCHEITYALFEGLAEQEATGLLALEYNARVGLYSCLVPGYDEVEPIDDCFDDFDGLMHELEDFMDRREQLQKIIEMAESEPLKSALDEYLHGEEEEEEADDFDEDEAEESTGEDRDEPPSKNALMDALKQAMADGDEERVQELFEQVQKNSQGG